MPGADSKTIIGKISYTNAWPVFHYVNPSTLDTPAEMITAVPAALNRGMHSGEIHIGALSSFAYAEMSDRLLLLPDLSVSADGAVNSIFLFSKKPLDALKNATIALTNTSATSVNLLKILLEKSLGGTYSYRTCDPVLSEMMAEADAALLIGDHAIRASWSHSDYYKTDLGQWWKEWTGCSMTFAVWAVNRHAVKQNPEGMAEIAAMFLESKQRSVSDLSPIVDEAVRRIGGTGGYWMKYFSNLCYHFDERQQEGLRLYFKFAYELGLLEREVVPELWNEKLSIRVNK
ncbi:ABC transporter substrate-binding protein [Paenibacillus glucanolyticus]|jgi:chorismate dehydratase|uniref:menaquinone biosynthesis protein n=1 Tax=Paenibacillus TaxID=44249 RepID=UPI0003E2C0E4|nr:MULTISPECIES: menaquinone biosynthesis protein [Paenibacillus]ANA82038.1 ABC transporter substrate-binding protein [Paenibacillus glucanolyticus]AVV59224.1 ABC transporter substrate-binding protein [Paenibacillus glucanolyticus]ETT43475.1 periplasmic solute-binding protein [Paenibacillus sp. FSL R5-808]MPY16254.1 menaquinone biosynthesis protein [Paenibacillus glucanolyticus]